MTARELGMERIYRNSLKSADLRFFTLKVEQTDLCIGVGHADGLPSEEDLSFAKQVAGDCVRVCRMQLESILKECPQWMISLVPLPKPEEMLPNWLAGMHEASQLSGTGPMAAVAGAIAAQVGLALRKRFTEVLVENGGDLWIAGTRERIIGIHSGNPRLDSRLAIRLPPDSLPVGLCTSSGTIGHSLSFGRADAATVLAKDAALADAVATGLGNRITDSGDLETALAWAMKVPGIKGALAFIEERMGVLGEIELTAG